MKLGFFDFYEKIQNKKLLEQDGFEPVQGAGMASMGGDSGVGNAPVSPQFNSFQAPANSTADPNAQYNGMDDNGELPEDENQDNLSEPEGGLDFNQVFSHLAELGKFTKELQGLEEDKGAEFEQILNQLQQLVSSFPGAESAQQMGQEGEEGQDQNGPNQRQPMPDNQNMPPPEGGPESEGGPGEGGPGGGGGFGGPGGGAGGPQLAGQSPQTFQGGSYPVAGGVPSGPGGIY
jgi:hypothetical protein